MLFSWNTGRMYDVAVRVRRAVPVEGLSRRELWLAEETVSHLLDWEECRRQQPIRNPKLAARLGVIGAILDEDKLLPKNEILQNTLLDNPPKVHDISVGDLQKAGWEGTELKTGPLNSPGTDAKRRELLKIGDQRVGASLNPRENGHCHPETK